MVKLLQKNPDFVTQEELENFLNDYENYICKFQRMSNDQQKFLYFLKKHRDIIEGVIKNISKIQLNVYSVTSINDHRFNFQLQDNNYSSTKSRTLRGGVIIETWTKTDLNQLKFALDFNISQKESFNYTAELSTLTFGGRWVPGIIFEKYYNYIPDNIQEGNKILFNINIHTPFSSGGGLNYGSIYHRFHDIELNQSIIESKSSIIKSKSRSNSNFLKKILLGSILIFTLYYVMEYFGYGYSYFEKNESNKKNENISNYDSDSKRIRKEIEKFNNGDPIYVIEPRIEDLKKGDTDYVFLTTDARIVGKIFHGKYPFGSYRRVWKEDVLGLSKNELEIMQNEIYARHGLIFNSRKISSYFKAQKWYKPKFENADKFLSEIEKGNLVYIEIMKVQLSD
jgi:hypothetical protein